MTSLKRDENPKKRQAGRNSCCLLTETTSDRRTVLPALESGGIKRFACLPYPALMDGKNSIRWERENGVQAFFSARNTWVVVPQIAHCPFMAGFPFFMNLAAGYPHLQWLLVVLFS